MLQLLYAPTSPFVRKVMVCAHLLDLAQQIKQLDSAAHPIDRDPRIAAHNPLGKVPTLILPDGLALYDSRIICEYLAHRANDRHIFPDSPIRWRALTWQALGDGLMDAALLARYEYTVRSETERSTAWRAAQLNKIQASLQAMESLAPTLAVPAPTIGEIAIGCALGYLDFRFPEIDWRSPHPQLAAWFADFMTLPAMKATIPHEA
ncbi:glutathione S-transferase family protein [Pseudomonas sp. S 311-6]|nr:glutathione S-transferase family protein [Pseudomonas sp. S 311-6]